MASIEIYVNDAELGSAAEAQNLLRGGSSASVSNAPEHMRAVGDWLKRKAEDGANTAACKVRVSGTSYVRAVGTITLTGQPTATETITLGAQVLTFVASSPGADDILIGADQDATETNITNAINAHATVGAFLSAVESGATIVCTCRIPGLVGNHIAFQEAASNLTMDGSGRLGGTTAGAGGDDTSEVNVVNRAGGTAF